MRPSRTALALILTLLTPAACRRRTASQAQTGGSHGAQPVQAGGGQEGAGTITAGGQGSVRSQAPTAATGCPASAAFAALGQGTTHNDAVEQNETWSLAGSPHRLPSGIAIRNNAVVTIEPCAVVLVGHGMGITVEPGAALVSVGDEQHPIRIGSDNPTPQAGDWTHVVFSENARATSRLVWTTIEHGGGEADDDACLVVESAGLDVQHVTLRACRHFGARLRMHGTFATQSADLRVTGGTAAGPHSGSVLVDDIDVVRSLPAGTYTGNANDEVYVSGSQGTHVATSGTWRNLGVRYHLGGADFHMSGASAPVLTIAPGATVAFDNEGGLYVGNDAAGGLIADGGGEQTRIRFTTAGTDRTPGRWDGLVFGPQFNRAQSRLAYATIEYGGGADTVQLCDWNNGNENSALLYIGAQPQPDMVRHVRFVGAPPGGAVIGRYWPGPAVDLAAAQLANDFSQAGAPCRQSPTPDQGGACAEGVACN